MDLIRLTRLTELRLDDNPIETWWQLRQRLPAALADLASLANLPLASNPIGDGWKHLPRQLQRLHVQCCRMQQVPPELARLTQLTSLSLADNPIESSWRYLPRQLQQLDLECTLCGLRLVPAELARLTKLTCLSLASNPIKGGWQHLPTQLRQLNLQRCGLKQSPAELAGLEHLQQLSLDHSKIHGSRRDLPRRLQVRMLRRRGPPLPNFLSRMSRMFRRAVWVPMLDLFSDFVHMGRARRPFVPLLLSFLLCVATCCTLIASSSSGFRSFHNGCSKPSSPGGAPTWLNHSVINCRPLQATHAVIWLCWLVKSRRMKTLRHAHGNAAIAKQPHHA